MASEGTHDPWAFDTAEIATQGRLSKIIVNGLPYVTVGFDYRPTTATGEFFFDLETIPDDSRDFGLEPLPPIPGETTSGLPDCQSLIAGTVDALKAALTKIPCPPSAWLEDLRKLEAAGKGRDGVFKAIESAAGAQQRVIELHAQRRMLLATTPEYCRIVAMGFEWRGDGPRSLIVDEDCSEQELLITFWQAAKKAKPFVAYNGLAFDLPVIFARSVLLDVPPTRRIDLTPWKGEVCDPYQRRFNGRSPGEGRPGKLKTLAKLYGIDVPAGDDDGSLVEELWRNDRPRLRKYVESDVAVLRDLYLRWQGMWT